MELPALPTACNVPFYRVKWAETELLWGELEGAKAWQGGEIVLVRDFRSRVRLQAGRKGRAGLLGARDRQPCRLDGARQ